MIKRRINIKFLHVYLKTLTYSTDFSKAASNSVPVFPVSAVIGQRSGSQAAFGTTSFLMRVTGMIFTISL
jgi:hypothetical protein